MIASKKNCKICEKKREKKARFDENKKALHGVKLLRVEPLRTSDSEAIKK